MMTTYPDKKTISLPLGRFPVGGRIMVYVAIGGFLGLIGPFGSYINDGGLITRLSYWMATWLICCLAFDLLLRTIAPRIARVPRLAVVLMTVMLATLPLSFGIHALATLIWPHLARIGWLEWYLQVLLVSAFYLVARLALPGPRPVPRAADVAPRLGSEVLCLQMEDHYVRVHSRDGSRLLLNSFGRAVAELRTVDGMQVHRSWWVARQAVEAMIEDGRNIRLRLINGIEAPVARTRIAALRAAGWL